MHRISPSKKIKQDIEEIFQGWEERGDTLPWRMTFSVLLCYTEGRTLNIGEG
ncbi:MAG: hypothetical protein JRF06_05020 [Deltaproteobacteria bacterium]|nr:hypothetical protein [Deltaproteobacteria bacterium]